MASHIAEILAVQQQVRFADLVEDEVGIEPLRWLYASGLYDSMDVLQQTHDMYGLCETHNKTQYYGLNTQRL